MPTLVSRLASAIASGRPTCPQPPMTTASSSKSRVVTGHVLPSGPGCIYPHGIFPRAGFAGIHQYRYGHDVVAGGLHPGDELFDPLVDRAERVLAQHGPLSLVVELQVHPVHGEVAPPLLRPADELAPEPGPGGLRRDR